MTLETMKEKIERIVHRGEEIADAEYRKLVGEVLALFHEQVTGEAIAPKPAAVAEPEVPNAQGQEENHDLSAGGEGNEDGAA